ncbi:uncharacterized protein LOC127724492 [Mytilus californianus]|uniref:uncharacterized protein LOC127724492 n=1 Tax=Mytilus californianus TaxID=6549 RepID=UPI002246A4DC|nr:uncharacterized protein LOC127724492 [Mytilus californianus]
MEGKNESDVDLTIQALDDIEKLGVEYRKQLRMVNTRIRNLQEDKLIEATLNEQKTDIISGKLEKIAAGNNEVTILLAKFQNNTKIWKELANLPMKREEKGRQTNQETDSGFGSATSKVLNSNILSGIQDTNPPGNEHQYCSEVDGEGDDNTENDKDSDTEC